QPIQRLPTPDRIRLGIALVPEGRQVFPKFSVIENLRMGAFQRADRDRLDADFETVFAVFPKLAERRHQKAGLMSGGEQQMLAIARGLMARPRLLLLDEPTLGLAPIIVEEIELAIGRLAGRGMTILLAEQNAAMVMRVAHRVYVLKSGRISLEGTPAALATCPEIHRLSLGTYPLHSQRPLIALLLVKLARIPRFFLLQREDRRVSAGPIGRHQAWARIVVRPPRRLAPYHLTIVACRQGIIGVGKGIGGGKRVEKQRPAHVGQVRLGAMNGAAIRDRDRARRSH